jgi:hypothetical protein
MERPEDADDAAEAYELAYAEAVRALSQQQIVIDNLRTRAGVLLSGAAIATSFLGQAALRRGTTVWSWLAITAFLLLGTAILLILWPRHDWRYAIRPRALIENYIEHADSLPVPAIHRDLTLHMDDSYLRNRWQLLELVRYLRGASVLLMLEVVAWVVDLLGTV